MKLLKRFVKNWLERHQHPFSFWIHMIGIPLAVFALPLGWFFGWIVGVSCFVIGYALQFWGHAVEGNDVGELILFKRWFGLPYVDVAPQYQSPANNLPAAPSSS